MKRTRVSATGLALVTALGLATPACTVSGSGTIGVEATTPTLVYDAPPAPRVETVAARPGFVWVNGRWDWRGGQWTWLAGHWERERANQSWIAGSWQLEGGHYVWIEGHWGAAAERGHGPVVRDHRR